MVTFRNTTLTICQLIPIPNEDSGMSEDVMKSILEEFALVTI